MESIKKIVFWVGGVIAPHVSDLTLKALKQDQTSDYESRLGLMNLESALYAGVIKPEEYCREVIQLLNLTYTPTALCDEILTHVHILEGMDNLLIELGKDYQLIWISNYPDYWLEKIASACSTKASCVIKTSQMKKVLSNTDLYLFLSNQKVLIPNETLLIDDNALRCMQATQTGFLVNIFVDSHRLRRDLNLWGLC